MHHALGVIVYLIRTSALGVAFSAHAIQMLCAYADSNWSEIRSTTGYVIYISGGPVCFNSKRQRCIAMSSCKSELIALADCAIEILYVLGVLADMGIDVCEPVEVYTDSKSAFNICHRVSAAQDTKHINRKVYKMREIRGSGRVVLKKIETEHNITDLFTKVLKRQVFEKFRAKVVSKNDMVCMDNPYPSTGGQCGILGMIMLSVLMDIEILWYSI